MTSGLIINVYIDFLSKYKLDKGKQKKFQLHFQSNKENNKKICKEKFMTLKNARVST